MGKIIKGKFPADQKKGSEAMRVGRNDPCPCGSGKKYKKCCLDKVNNKLGSDSKQDVMAAIREKLERGQFSSLEDAQAELNQFMHTKNTAPLDDFHGISSTQMHRFIHFPFDSPALIGFADILEPPLEAPVLRLFSLLVDGVGEKGMNPTAKGNLPQKFCREAALAFWGEEKYEERTKHGQLHSEMDFFDMHSMRLLAELAGLIRKYKGKFIVTQKCRKKIASHGIGSVYLELFQAYISKFNWAYRDGYEELGFIQQSFIFTLYLLQKYGGEIRLHTFYEDIFVKAFPQLLNEIIETPYKSAEETVRRVYTHRVLEDFAAFFGLIKFSPTSKDFRERQYEVTKLPLLDQVVTFDV